VSVTIAEILHEGQSRLHKAGFEDANLEAEVLLRHTLGIDRARLFSRLQEGIEGERERDFLGLIERRLMHEPVAYIAGHKEFYGIDLEVTPVALIPRPETELLVDEALRGTPKEPCTLADIGTGCGAVAIALAMRLPRHTVFAIDSSEEALALASRNVERLGLGDRVRLLQGDLLDPLPMAVEVIAANLPYVKTGDWEKLPPEIRDHEPRQALDGGPDGTTTLERFLQAAPSRLRPGGCLVAEIGWDEGGRLTKVAEQCFPGAQIEVIKDFAGLDRVLRVQTFGDARLRFPYP
jgi:release factor glutamine methyltransferase